MRQWVLAGSVFVGLLFPDVARWLGPLFLPSLFAVILFALLNLKPTESIALPWLTWRKAGLIVLLQMLLLPTLVVVVLQFIIDPDLLVWLVFFCAASSLFGAPAFAGLMGIPRGLVLAGVLCSTILLPFSVLLASALTDATTMALDFGVYAQRVGVFLLLPLCVAGAYHALVQKLGRSLSSTLLENGMVISLVIFAIAVMDGVTEQFISDPWFGVLMVAGAVTLHAALFAIGWLMLRPLGKSMANVAGMLFAFRNAGLLAAVTGGAESPEFMIFVGVWQIPMYLAPLIAKFKNR